MWDTADVLARKHTGTTNTRSQIFPHSKWNADYVLPRGRKRNKDKECERQCVSEQMTERDREKSDSVFSDIVFPLS